MLPLFSLPVLFFSLLVCCVYALCRLLCIDWCFLSYIGCCLLPIAAVVACKSLLVAV